MADETITRFAAQETTLVAEAHLQWAQSCLQGASEQMQADEAKDLIRPGEDFWRNDESMFRPYTVEDGVLYIPVFGVLLHRFPLALGSFATGYDYISAAIKRGMEDSNVRGIVLETNSPGGMVAGCFDTVDRVYEARGTKPIEAVVDENAYSAAYAIVSAADRITVARTGGVGSVGVLHTHMSMARMLEQIGVDVTLVKAGEHKAEGHPAVPLSDHARKRSQERANETYEIFVSTVARNRALDEAAVRRTEADTFSAREGVENGLADRIGAHDETVAEIATYLGQLETEDFTMSSENKGQGAESTDAKAAETARTEGYKDGHAAGATAERERVAAIMDSEEAKTRPVAARNVALKTNMTAQDATGFLQALPEESKGKATRGGTEEEGAEEKGPSAFENAMNAGSHPEVGASDEEAASGQTQGSVSERIFASAGYSPRG